MFSFIVISAEFSLVSLIPVFQTLDILDPQTGFLVFSLSFYLTLWKISSNLSSSHPNCKICAPTDLLSEHSLENFP